MGSLVEMQVESARAFQGLEVSVGLCAVGMAAVLGLLQVHFLLAGRPKVRLSRTKPREALAAFCLLLAILFCVQVPAGFTQSAGDGAPQSVAAAGKYPSFGLHEDEARLLQGKKVYQTYCMGCHGVKGDGQGPAAGFLNPKPRNFISGEYRFSSRPSGDVPTDQDLFRTITEGLHGSSMPAWNLMPESDRWAVVAYLKTFAPDKWKFMPGAETTVAEDPYMNQPVEIAVKRGETAYHGMAMCYSCHAAYIAPEKINAARAVYGMPPLKAFRKDLGTSQSMQTSDGSVIVPPDFLWNKLKRGIDLQTLYHVVGNGISGTPMPTWKGILPEEDLWGIVYYVRFLAEQRPSLVTDEDVRAYYGNVAKLESERLAYEEAARLADSEALKKAAEEKKKAAETAALIPAKTAAVSKTPEVKEPSRV